MRLKDFRVKQKTKVDLEEWPTRIKADHRSKKHYQELLAKQIEAMSELQNRLYADNHQSLLIIFQAMDAAGKDSAIKHVMSGLNPQGCQVFSFKHPSAEELDHDFLWRTTRCLPERGRIGIFNRSYYEEVLILRVHPELLLAQGLVNADPESEQFWEDRYQSIVDLEQHLTRNGTRIIKFFLHLSKEEQCERFLSRIEEPEKNWKFSLDDLKERACWKQYQQAYETCLSTTSSREAPWYVVPADDKETARLIIADIVVDTLSDMNPHYPQLGAKQLNELQQAKELLHKETSK
ncbi:MAG: ADP-polyphosphate phosphotransferase [Steroidobacteraceae bacterium]